MRSTTGSEASLSVVIVLYNSADHLPACLASLDAELHEWRAELIAVDNASPDSSRAIVEQMAPTATVVSMGTNAGYSAGANAGIAVAKSRYVLLLNPDLIVPAGGLQTLVEWMDEHPRISAATPLLTDGDGRAIPTDLAFASVGKTLLETARLHKFLPRKARGRILRGQYAPQQEQLDGRWIPGTALILRRSSLASIGGFDERLFMYGEDIEWCWRAARKGHRVGVCAATTFVHLSSTSAIRSWGAERTRFRIETGIHRAYCIIYGRRHGHVLALAMAVAKLLEAAAPSRSPSARRAALRQARAHTRLALDTRASKL